MFKIKRKRKLKIIKYKNIKCFKYVLKSTFNFIKIKSFFAHWSMVNQVLLTIKLIWFGAFYLPVCICRNFLKLRLDCYVAIAQYNKKIQNIFASHKFDLISF